MLSSKLAAILQDLTNRKDVTAPIARVLNVEKRTVPIAQQLDFTKALLDVILRQPTSDAAVHFPAAISCLRALAPSLKADDTSSTEVIARIEKSTVKFALLVSERSRNPDVRECAIRELGTALRLLCESRLSSSSKTSRRSQRSSARPGLVGSHKENSDPQVRTIKSRSRRVSARVQPPNVCTPLDTALFFGSSEHPMEALLPNKDSSLVTRVISGALTMRLTSPYITSTLSDRIYILNTVVIPWLRYLEQFPEPSNCEYATCFSERLSRYLKAAVQSEPCIYVMTRALVLSLTLQKASLDQFVRDLHKAILKLISANNAGLMHQDSLDVVVSLYENSLQFVKSFPIDDPFWQSEDVSVWLDHVLHVWARINARALPNVFEARAAVARQSANFGLGHCFQLQMDFFNLGAYSQNAILHTDREDLDFVDPVWKDVDRILKPLDVPDFFREGIKFPFVYPNLEDVPAEQIIVYMRFLHTIDPLRNIVLSSPEVSSSLLQSNEYLLRQHMSTTLAGLQLLSNTENSKGQSADAERKRLIVRMNVVVGGAMEAAKALVSLYWIRRELNMLCNVITFVAFILQHHGNWYRSYMTKWWEWFFNSMKSALEDARAILEVSRNEEREDDEHILISVLRHSEEIVTIYCDCVEELPSWAGLLRTLRKLYVSRKEWRDAVSVSVKLLVIEYAGKEESENTVIESAQFFVQDLVRAISNDSEEEERFDCLDFLKDGKPSFGFLFGLLMEYQCYIRKNVTSFRTRESYLETLSGLQRGRKFLLDHAAVGRECLLRRLHRLWLDFIFGRRVVWMSKEGKRLKRDLQTDDEADCDGHVETSAFECEMGTAPCSTSFFSFLAGVADMWRLVEEGNFADIGDLIEDIEQLQTISSLESYGREFLLLCAEILDWTSVSLALHDYDIYALQVNSLSEECREALGIPRSYNPILRELCARVANSELFQWYFDGREDDDWAAPLREVRLLCAESNYNDALRIVESIDDAALPPYEKALAYEHGRGDITSALFHSHKALKQIVRRMASGKENITSSDGKFLLGGATINIDTNIRIDAGQEHMHRLLELTRILFQYACLYFEAENINLGQYYMERCYKLASQCLPKNNFMLLSISAVYHAKLKVDNPVSLLQECLSLLDIDSHQDDPKRNIISEYEMWSNITGCRYRHSQSASKDDVIRAYDVCEGRVQTTTDDNEEWRKRVEMEVVLQKAIALSNIGDTEKAVDLMKPLMKNRVNFSISLQALGRYHFARSLCLLNRERIGPPKTPRRRTTRSRKKVPSPNENAKEVESTIENTIQLISPEFNVPWICRRVYGLRSLTINPTAVLQAQECSAEVALLGKKIGSSFNVRWQFSLKSKMEQMVSQGVTMDLDRVQQLQNLFQNMTIGDLDNLMKLLGKNKCVVVGIDIDDLRENLIMWRICRNGTFIEKKKLPGTGPASLRGIIDRIDRVVSIKRDVPEPREKLSNKAKTEWWADRFRLDEELGTIVSEIESEWIDEIGYLLDPELGEESCPEVNDEDLEQVVLLVDTALERIPWESVGVLRERVISVTRVPSLAFLDHYLRVPAEDIRQDDMFYLINPTGEFSKTASRFRDVTIKQRGWKGFCGPCTKEDVNSVYNGQRMYMYCGHGTGVAFMSPRRFERVENAPTILLMGCSSAKPDNLGIEDEESNGAAIDFLIRGAPAVVGTLWDVSDGEIDRFTLSLLSLWAGASEKRHDGTFVSLAEAVARSRSACRTPYLVGAACIVLGAPNIRVKPSRGRRR